jgi:flavin reductase (DIM6/NTAB) family NADH-FMN oxidoreductase RutF
MNLDFNTLDKRTVHKLLLACVVPRPIALVSSLSVDGIVNAAAFSFFNAMSYDPPIIVLGVASKPGKAGDAPVAKDTGANIRDTGEFVVNLVDEITAERMNICSIDFPPEIDELEVSGFTAAPSIQVKPPRIAESPVSFECKRFATVEVGIGRNIIIGQVVHFHIRDDLIDTHKMYVATDRMRLVGRMHGGSWYAKTSDLFELPRVDYASWVRSTAKQAADND